MATKKATAKIARIYPLSSGGCFVKLAITPTNPNRPKEGYFRLPEDHVNYKSIYALALLAAVNNYNVTIRTVEDISRTKHAEISYLYVDW